MGDISASMTNGTLTRQGDHWVARPGQVGSDATVTVTANMDGKPIQMAQTKFRVRKLPDPTPFIAFKDASGNTDHYRGGKPFKKALLLASPASRPRLTTACSTRRLLSRASRPCSSTRRATPCPRLATGRSSRRGRNSSSSVSAEANASTYRVSGPRAPTASLATCRLWR